MFFQPTPEQQAEMEEAAKAAEMARDAHFHSMMGFFDTLSEEQAKSALGVMAHIQGDPDSIRFFRGYLVSVMEHRFGICAACGKNHAEEIADLGTDEDGAGSE